jgi:hypothetical protein
MDEKRISEIIEWWAKVDPSKIQVVSPFGPDEPLGTFLSLFGIKRMLVINTDREGKKHVLRVLKKFANDRKLEFKIFNASGASVEDVRGQIEIVWIDGEPYHQRKRPSYWPENRGIIVVEGVNQETDIEVLRAFLYVACMPYGEDRLQLDQLPYGSGFVFLAYHDFPVQRFASITDYFRDEYATITWPPAPYTKERVIYETRVAMQNIGQLYQQSFINWKGKTRDDNKQLYTEVIAEELLESGFTKKLNSLPPVQRKGYYVGTHDGNIKRQTYRKEEILAKRLFNYSQEGNNLGELGKIFDYQVPLKSVRYDKAGKIDLVSLNREENTIWLVELKWQDSKETLLRCVLEVATYYQLLDKDTFIQSYTDILDGLRTDCIHKAVLVFKDGSQHEEIKEMKDEERSKLKELVNSLDINFFLLEESGLKFTVEKVQL